ncbi:MAG: GGDEF domain-containing protein [Ignavibacteria bacterium]
MAHLPDIGSPTLRRLLVLARDLLQAHDRASIPYLVGPAMREIMAADEALLLLRAGGKEDITEFDRDGRLQPGRAKAGLDRYARKALQERTPIVLPVVGMPPDGVPDVHDPMSIIAFPFPPIEPVGVLAAVWFRRSGDDFARPIAALHHIGELTAAALGNVVLRDQLEAHVIARSEEIAQAAREHAEELGRRDSIEDELQHIANTDVMTGMLNRRGFFLKAEWSLKVARRRGIPSALIFADIDRLKSVNDTLGHDVGDHLIQDGATILHGSFRDSDVVARLGGDEFAAFALDAPQPEAILARIRKNIDDFHQRLARPYRVSFSTGIIACNPSSDLTLADYLSQADQQMYEQKRSRQDH